MRQLIGESRTEEEGKGAIFVLFQPYFLKQRSQISCISKFSLPQTDFKVHIQVNLLRKKNSTNILCDYS